MDRTTTQVESLGIIKFTILFNTSKSSFEVLLIKFWPHKQIYICLCGQNFIHLSLLKIHQFKCSAYVD